MIKILAKLKEDNKTLYHQIENQLEKLGVRSSKSYYNKLNFNDYLDLVSFSDTYVFQPDQYQMVQDVLADLNPTENTFLSKLTKTKPKDYSSLQQELAVANNRTRAMIITLLDKNKNDEKLTFSQRLSNLKQTVFS